jgi:hypothetical protein
MPKGTGSSRSRALPELTPRERLLFEVGIKLGGIFHQYLGIPVTPRTAPALSRSIEQAVALQPFVREVRVKIDPARGGPVGRGRYGYRYLTAEMVRARVTVGEGHHRVVAELSPDRRLRYPLMKVVKASPRALAEPR